MSAEHSKKRPTVGRFRITDHLGKGGQGSVFKAVDPDLGREVALKVITKKGDSPASRFVEEARIVARIAHPNVIPLYDALEHKGQPVLVFEYVPGQTLKALLAEHGPYGEPEALSIMVRIAVGLAAAHKEGILHLDLTPNNVMMDAEGRPRIMDFGLARLSAPTHADDASPVFKGTPRYISPEHLQYDGLSAATDIYALGLVFYELLAGVPARRSKSLASLLEVVRSGYIDWAPLQDRGVSPELIALLRDMLQVDPAARYQDAGELVPELDDVIELIRQQGNAALALDFLKRRIRRRPEFPAFSDTLIEINRLTAEGSNATFEDLGQVIMRDYSMTNRLIKIANSAFFDRGAGGVGTVSQAVSRLGLNLVRMICNGLLVFDKLGSGSEALRDAMVQSFVAGLMARDIVGRHKRAVSEEAFICGLFHHLGRNLVMYYLELEHEDIESLVASGSSRIQAELKTLGTPSFRLGVAVAGEWKFPATIMASMEPVTAALTALPEDDADLLRAGASLANELCDRIGRAAESPAETAAAVVRKFAPLIQSNAEALVTVVEDGLGKFCDLAPSLEVETKNSAFCRSLEAFVAAARAETEEAAAV